MYTIVIDKNEVVQFMSSLSPDLIEFSHDLIGRGYDSLGTSVIAYVYTHNTHILKKYD